MTSPPASTATDVLNALAGVRDGSPFAALRLHRADATTHTQGSYDALFHTSETGGLSHLERFAAALRVASLHTSRPSVEHFRSELQAAGAVQRIVAEVEAQPDQRAPHGPDLDQTVSPRLQAILKHADLLSLRPARATADDLQLLAFAGLSTREIVSLSQVIAFTSFFTRVLTALQLLGGEASSQALPSRLAASAEKPRAPQPADHHPTRERTEAAHGIHGRPPGVDPVAGAAELRGCLLQAGDRSGGSAREFAVFPVCSR